jgi:multicomponent K+:H+ antiporter subunit D
MTKVGVYAILRVVSVVLVPLLSASGPYVKLWVAVAGAATLAVGGLGALAADRFLRMAAHLAVLSVGTILLVVASAEQAPLAAALFYLVHSTLAGALLFLVAGEVAAQRGSVEDRLRRAAPIAQPALLGGLMLITGAAVVGLPPFSGFLAKALLLQATVAAPPATTITVWSAVLLGSFLALIALARAGITMFWAARRDAPVSGKAGLAATLGAGALLACVLALSVLAEPVRSYTDAVAAQLLDSAAYVEAVQRTGGR